MTTIYPKACALNDIDVTPTEAYIVKNRDDFPEHIRMLRRVLMSNVFDCTAPTDVRARALTHIGAQLEPGVFVRQRVPDKAWDVQIRDLRSMHDIDDDLKSYYGYIQPALEQLDGCLDTVYRDYLLEHFLKDNVVYRVTVAAAIVAIKAHCEAPELPRLYDAEQIFCNGMHPPLFDDPIGPYVECEEIMRHLSAAVDEHGESINIPHYPTLERHIVDLVDAVDERGRELPCERKLALVALFTTIDCKRVTIRDIDWAIETLQAIWSGDIFVLGTGDIDYGQATFDILDN